MEEKNNIEENKTDGSSKIEESNIAEGFGAEAYQMELQLRKQERAEEFRRMGLASVIYAVFYVLCLYDNTFGVFNALWAVGTVLYAGYAIKINHGLINKGTWAYMAAIILLGIGCFTTGNYNVIFCNKAAIFVLLICCLLHSFYQDHTWNIGKYLGAICQSIFGAIGTIGGPFSGGLEYLKTRSVKKKKQQLAIYILIGVCVSLPLMALIMGMLMSADAVFSSLFSEMMSYIVFPKNIMSILIMLIFAFLSSYCGVTYLARRKIRQEMYNGRNVESVIGIVIASAVNIIYVPFSLIQIIYLFFGRMKLPEGYSYAEYAREGFFQLLFICVLNLIIVVVGMEFFKRNIALKVLLTVLSVCTYIMIASSAYRMIMYIRSYDLSFLRVAVLWILAALAVLLTGLLVHIYKEEMRLFPFCVTVVTVFYLAFGFSHPDYYIALYNLDHCKSIEAEENTDIYAEEGEQKADYSYLVQLSTDAAPAIYEHANDRFKEADGYKNLYDDKVRYWFSAQNIRTFNLSQFIAGLYLTMDR